MSIIVEAKHDEHFVEMIAHACHERNRAYCIATNDPNTAPPWTEYSQANRAITHSGVVFMLDILTKEKRSIHDFNVVRFDIDDFSKRVSPLSHENWLKDKVESGWVYGELKDFDKKTHPCIVPYDQLPWLQRVKDSIFSQEVYMQYYNRFTDNEIAQIALKREGKQ